MIEFCDWWYAYKTIMGLKCYTFLDFFTKIGFPWDPIKLSVSTQTINKTKDSQRFSLFTKNIGIKNYLTVCIDGFPTSLKASHHLKCPIMTQPFWMKPTIQKIWSASGKQYYIDQPYAYVGIHFIFCIFISKLCSLSIIPCISSRSHRIGSISQHIVQIDQRFNYFSNPKS